MPLLPRRRHHSVSHIYRSTRATLSVWEAWMRTWFTKYRTCRPRSPRPTSPQQNNYRGGTAGCRGLMVRPGGSREYRGRELAAETSFSDSPATAPTAALSRSSKGSHQSWVKACLWNPIKRKRGYTVTVLLDTMYSSDQANPGTCLAARASSPRKGEGSCTLPTPPRTQRHRCRLSGRLSYR